MAGDRERGAGGFAPGTVVMSTDPGGLLVPDVPPHGPWIVEGMTKGGLVWVRHQKEGTRRRVAPRHLTEVADGG